MKGAAAGRKVSSLTKVLFVLVFNYLVRLASYLTCKTYLLSCELCNTLKKYV